MTGRIRPGDLVRLRPLLLGGGVPPGLRVDNRYEIVRKIGRGGMGEVHLARDLRLDRPVALKVLAPGLSGPGFVRRFRNEVAALARVEHPGVVPIHDVGSLPDGRSYYTMKYVDGQTLEELRRGGVATEELLSILAAAAEALQHAHERGIIHRDLKPSNVMVDREGHVFVIDWGVARVADDLQREEGGAAAAPGATRVGAVLGTDEYMSPEQAAGLTSAVTAASDVYSLGAVLHEILTGRPPSGTPSFGSAVSEDLQAVGRKALQPDPANRYASAREMAGDLRRFLSGRTVSVRRPAPPERLGRWTRRHPGQVVAGVLGIAAVAAALLQWRDRAAQVEDIRSTLLSQLRETTDACLKAALALRRTGDLEGMQAFVEKTAAACREVKRAAPGLAEPYHRHGRILRAALRFDEALKEQEEALRKEPDYAPSRYERGLLLYRRYEERIDVRIEDWRRIQGELAAGERGRAELQPPPRERLEDEAATKLRQGALQDLTGIESPMARGLRCRMSGKRAEAAALLEAALDAIPEEEGRFDWLGRWANQDGDLEKAIAWFTRGIERDRGYLPYFIGRGVARMNLASTAAMSGQPADFGPALEDLEHVVKVRPGHPWAWCWLGFTRVRRVMFSKPDAPDIPEAYRRCVEAFDQAILLAPKEALFWTWKGAARANLAAHLFATKEDQVAHWERAVEDHRAALRVNPDLAEAWVNLGATLNGWGMAVQDRGGDPSASYSESIEASGQAVRLNPIDVHPWRNRGWARLNLGKWLGDQGRDPSDVFREALADLDEGIRFSPNHYECWQRRGIVNATWGAYLLPRRLDPSARLTTAIADLTKAIQLNPANARSYRYRGLARRNLAAYTGVTGGDPAELIRTGLEDFDASLRLYPPDGTARLNRADLRAMLGDTLRAGGDPRPVYRAALEDAEEAARLNPRLAGQAKPLADRLQAWLNAPR